MNTGTGNGLGVLLTHSYIYHHTDAPAQVWRQIRIASAGHVVFIWLAALLPTKKSSAHKPRGSVILTKHKWPKCLQTKLKTLKVKRAPYEYIWKEETHTNKKLSKLKEIFWWCYMLRSIKLVETSGTVLTLWFCAWSVDICLAALTPQSARVTYWSLLHIWKLWHEI